MPDFSFGWVSQLDGTALCISFLDANLAHANMITERHNLTCSMV